MQRLLLAAGALSGAFAVAMAAVIAHALPPGTDAHAQAALDSAVQMQGWHALALMFTSLWLAKAGGGGRGLALAAGAGFALGSVLFCGAIYGHHLLGIPTGSAAPFGGVCLIVAWLLLAASALRADGAA